MSFVCGPFNRLASLRLRCQAVGSALPWQLSPALLSGPWTRAAGKQVEDVARMRASWDNLREALPDSSSLCGLPGSRDASGGPHPAGRQAGGCRIERSILATGRVTTQTGKWVPGGPNRLGVWFSSVVPGAAGLWGAQF